MRAGAVVDPELWRALAVFAEPQASAHAELAESLELPRAPDAAESTRVLAMEVHPFASVYLGEAGMLGGEAYERVAGFWRALGRTPPPEADHCAALLGLCASLGEESRAGDVSHRLLASRALEALVWEHCVTWMPMFAAGLRKCGVPFYDAWAGLLMRALRAETVASGLAAAGLAGAGLAAAGLGGAGLAGAELAGAELAAAGLPAALADQPDGLSADDMEDPFVLCRRLVAPIRCGFVITRSTLRQMARELGLGLRMGERSYVLQSCLAQDPSGVLSWLSGYACKAADGHRDQAEWLGPVALWWEGRARSAAGVLGAASGRPDFSGVPSSGLSR